MTYSSYRAEVVSSPVLVAWLDALADVTARSRIAERIARFELGLFDDVKLVGGGVCEMRVDHDPGYRVYCTRRGAEIVILLCGATRAAKTRDIDRAQSMALEM